MRCIIAVDDTDSSAGRCTTHLGYRVVASLLSQGCVFARYPRLVRLNPNIPFKTRGNAAVCLDFETDKPEEAFKVGEKLMRELSDVKNGANSGAVFLKGDPDPSVFRPLYESAVAGVVNPGRVRRILEETGIRHFFLGNGMGLVGAMASIGFDERDDHTYELVAYRRPENLHRPRVVDPDSVRRAESEMFPHCFNSYDYSTDRVLITQHGPDPVFLGIRADSPDVALAAFRMTNYEEELEGYMVYMTNQCTDAHLKSELPLPLSAYSSGWMEGTISSIELAEGGHLYFLLSLKDETVPAVVYKEAGDLSREARRLKAGDVVRVFGGVRRGTSKHPPILNVEKLEVMRTGPVVQWTNPRCEVCGGSTKSEGKGKGFQCRSCGARIRSASKSRKTLKSSIQPGVYLPSPGSQRHLTKQLVRYGAERHSVFRPKGEWIRADGVRPLRAPVRSPV